MEESDSPIGVAFSATQRQLCLLKVTHKYSQVKLSDSCLSGTKVFRYERFSRKPSLETIFAYGSGFWGAQKLGPLQRIEMERFAGTLLEAPLQ